MIESAQEQAIAMRRAGHSLRQIAAAVGASLGAVHNWTVDAAREQRVNTRERVHDEHREHPSDGAETGREHSVNGGCSRFVNTQKRERAVNVHGVHGVHDAGVNTDPVEEVLRRLGDVKKKGNQWEANCPAHEDDRASLSVSRGKDGRALVNCFAGCSPKKVVAALGMSLKDLFVGGRIPRPRIVATYDYHNVDGEVLFQVVRYEPKDFRQRKPDGKGGWTWKLGDTPKVLYRLPELAGADRDQWVFIAEGEKDVDNLWALGLPATCNPGGACKWSGLADDSHLNGRRVVIIPDRDIPGEKHAADVAHRLSGRIAELRTVHAPEGYKDVSDWIVARDALTPDEMREVLLSRIHANDGEATACLTPPARADPAGPAKLGERDPATGRIVLSARRTLPTAKAFVNEFFSHADGRTLHSYAGLLLEWSHNHYSMIEDEAVKNRLIDWLDVALRYVTNPVTRELELVDFDSNPTTVKAALDTLRTYVHLSASTSPPAWLGDPAVPYEARDILPCLTCNLHLPTQTSIPPTPRLFNMNALAFDFDPKAPAPERWLQFLAGIWGDDHEQISLLQEWFGYCLTADTAQQKMLLIIGPKRSGKGTIARVLTRLIGAGNVAGPTTSSLIGVFGLQPLIGKSLAIVSDARFSGDNIAVVVERLLCISGEDALTIDRKFLDSVTMKLPTRFMFLTNELPRLTDASGALTGRFLFLQMKQSFYGREDTELTDRLLVELPGILNWAIEGWWRLRQRGKFVQPASVADAIRDTEDLASPVLAFVRDRCILHENARIWVDDLYEAWRVWCESDGRFNVTTKQVFGRDLRAAVPGLATRRGSANARFYEGLQLKVAA